MILEVKTISLRIATVVATIHLLFSSVVGAQSLRNHGQVDSLYSSIQKKYDSISVLVSKWNKDSSYNQLILVPVLKCKFESGSKENLSFEDPSDILVIDSCHSSVYIYNISNKTLSLKGRSSAQILGSYFQERKRDREAFIYFFDKDAKELDIIANLSNNGSLTFRSKNVEKTEDIRKILVGKFGTIEQYENYRRIENHQGQVAQGIRETFSNFTINNHWQFYSLFFPANLAENLSLLSHELQLATGLPADSISLILNDIQREIRNGIKIGEFQVTSQMAQDARYGKLIMIPFLGVNILPILSNHLNKQQLDTYIIAYKINSGAATRMRSSLGNRFKNEQSAIKRYVLTNIVVKSQKPLTYSLRNDRNNPAIIITF